MRDDGLPKLFASWIGGRAERYFQVVEGPQFLVLSPAATRRGRFDSAERHLEVLLKVGRIEEILRAGLQASSGVSDIARPPQRLYFRWQPRQPAAERVVTRGLVKKHDCLVYGVLLREFLVLEPTSFLVKFPQVVHAELFRLVSHQRNVRHEQRRRTLVSTFLHARPASAAVEFLELLRAQAHLLQVLSLIVVRSQQGPRFCEHLLELDQLFVAEVHL